MSWAQRFICEDCHQQVLAMRDRCPGCGGKIQAVFAFDQEILGNFPWISAAWIREDPDDQAFFIEGILDLDWIGENLNLEEVNNLELALASLRVEEGQFRVEVNSMWGDGENTLAALDPRQAISCRKP